MGYVLYSMNFELKTQALNVIKLNLFLQGRYLTARSAITYKFKCILLRKDTWFNVKVMLRISV